ncbi:MAG: hypothetical protein M0C28_39075 [Candidatus Moduliflexus flocculans]|nr:hypothetical protein [Candidatus Moduliflexus flocculans]
MKILSPILRPRAVLAVALVAVLAASGLLAGLAMSKIRLARRGRAQPSGSSSRPARPIRSASPPGSWRSSCTSSRAGLFPVAEGRRPARRAAPGRISRRPTSAGARPCHTSGLAAESIVVRTAGNDLVLAGGGPRGTLYAVYTFLEDVVGCRWWTVDGQPHALAGRLSKCATSTSASSPRSNTASRTGTWPSIEVWAARNKSNGTRAGGDALRGGRQVYEGFVHTFYGLIPAGRIFRRASGVVQRDRRPEDPRERPRSV